MMHRLPLMGLVIALLVCAPAAAVVPDQIDTFGSGTTLGWTGGVGGGQPAPAWQSTGGPLGVGDGFTLLSTTGFHLGSYNSSQWTGDYVTAGVTGIEMDLSVFGPDDAAIRLLLFGPGGTWATTNRAMLTAPSGWQQVSFGLTAADMVYVSGGTGSLADTLTGVDRLLIRNDTAVPTPIGNHPPHITSDMGIDNIHAVPEPATMSLLVGGLVALAARRRGRR